MASQESTQKLKDQFEIFKSIETNKIYRTSLGALSLENRLAPIITEIIQMAEYALQYVNTVNEGPVNSCIKTLNSLVKIILPITTLTDQEYASTSPEFLNSINAQLTTLRDLRIHFVAASEVTKDTPSENNASEEYQKFILQMQQQSGKALEDFQEQSNKIVENAKTEAEKIETMAVETAEGISVVDAQKQFKKAQIPIFIQIGIWLVGSGVALGFFFSFVLQYIDASKDLSNTWTWQLAAWAGMRMTFLAALASIATYCMRILKSQLHMLQYNFHRIHLTNSLGALIGSGVDKDQRRIILAELVRVIADFGGSGLIPNDSDGINPSKSAIDSISCSINSGAGS